MKNYILLYGDKKPEDNICIKNMFPNNKQINLGWTDFDYNKNMKMIEDIIKDGIEQIIYAGFEVGWDKQIKTIKEIYPNIIVKVICNTSDSLLYYEYERNNFFRMLEFSKDGIIDDIAFLKKGQYKVYKELGYKCSYLMQNYKIEEKQKVKTQKQNDKINIGIYPLNYTWDKNIFNQLCIGRMIENSNINFNELDERMKDFLDTMEIENTKDKINNIEEKEIIQKVIKNDITISCSFTEYFHTIFFLSMENNVPCIIGNTSDLFEENEELQKYIVTEAEDNAILNSELVKKCLENKEKVIQLYKIWKQKYNKQADENIKAFLEK